MAVMVSVGLDVLTTPVVALVMVSPTTEALMVRPLPAGPGVLLLRMMRVKDPDAVATTFSSPLALISATSASRMVEPSILIVSVEVTG